MTEQDVQSTQDTALGQYTRLKQTLAATKQRLTETGQIMVALGQDIQKKDASQWQGFAFRDCPWLNPDVIRSLAQDVITAQDEVRKAREKAINLGVALSD